MKVLNLELQGAAYPITVGAGLLEKIETLININTVRSVGRPYTAVFE